METSWVAAAGIFVSWTGVLIAAHFAATRSLREELADERSERRVAEARADAKEAELKTVYNEKWMLMGKLLRVGTDDSTS